MPQLRLHLCLFVMRRRLQQAKTLPSRELWVASAMVRAAGHGMGPAGHHSLHRRRFPLSLAGCRFQQAGRQASPSPVPRAAAIASLEMPPEHHLPRRLGRHCRWQQQAAESRRGLARAMTEAPLAVLCARHAATSEFLSPAAQKRDHLGCATQFRRRRHRFSGPHSMRRCRAKRDLSLEAAHSNSGPCRRNAQARGACGLRVATLRRGTSVED